MFHDVWTPMITSDPSLRNKSLRPRNKVAHVELLQVLVRPVPRYAVTVIYRHQQRKNKEDFLFSKKKSTTKKITATFGKSLFLIKYQMSYAIYMPPNTKDLAINQAMVVYGNRQNATAIAWANNSDFLRPLKHLMETRLNRSAGSKHYNQNIKKDA